MRVGDVLAAHSVDPSPLGLTLMWSCWCGAVAGKSTAKDMSKNIIKLVMKVGVLWNEHVLNAEMLEPLREPIVALGNCVADQLGKRPGSLDPEPLAALIRAAYEAVLPIIQPHMKVCA